MRADTTRSTEFPTVMTPWVYKIHGDAHSQSAHGFHGSLGEPTNDRFNSCRSTQYDRKTRLSETSRMGLLLRKPPLLT